MPNAGNQELLASRRGATERNPRTDLNTRHDKSEEDGRYKRKKG
jgi:hypothetical protein